LVKEFLETLKRKLYPTSANKVSRRQAQNAAETIAGVVFEKRWLESRPNFAETGRLYSPLCIAENAGEHPQVPSGPHPSMIIALPARPTAECH
jgi:hypothetical protein